MYVEKSLALAFSLMILGQAYLVKRFVGTWLFPACLFGLFWFGFTFFPLAALFWVPVYPYAVGFLFLCTVAFSLGAIPFEWKTAFAKNVQGSDALVHVSTFLKIIFYLSALASVLSLSLYLAQQGFSLHDLIFNSVASAATYIANSQTLEPSGFERVTIICAYLTAVVGGFLFSQMKSWRIAALSFLPAGLVALTESVKGHLLLCIVFFYAALLAQRTLVGNFRLVEKRHIKFLAFGLAIVILIATIGFLSRGLYGIEDRDVFLDKLTWYWTSYSCAHIYAFSDWFSFAIGKPTIDGLGYAHEGGPTYGFYTFMPLFKLMGSHKDVSGVVSEDYFSYGDVLTSNVFTMFRGLILDFGFVGSVAFMFVTGLLFHWNFHAMLLRRPVFTIAVFVFMLPYFYMSFIISLLIWTRIYVAFFLLWIVLQIDKRILRAGGRRMAIPGTAGELALRP